MSIAKIFQTMLFTVSFGAVFQLSFEPKVFHASSFKGLFAEYISFAF